MPNRVVFLIDGFNLYHSLNDNPSYRQYKWMDLTKLAKCFVTRNDEIRDIFFFTAITRWSPDKTARHKNYIRAVESKNVHVIHGNFRHTWITCRYCGESFKKFEEKQTDVNIAIQLLRLAHANHFDTAMIVSGDSDLAPAIEAVKELYPSKQIGIIIPIGRRAEFLKRISNFHRKIKQKHLISSLMENRVMLSDGTEAINPYV